MAQAVNTIADAKGNVKPKKPKLSREVIKENLQLYSLMLPVLILILIFCYIPMYGIIIAFQNYTPGSPFIGDNVKWVGLKHFITFVQGEYFGRLIKNTLGTWGTPPF